MHVVVCPSELYRAPAILPTSAGVLFLCPLDGAGVSGTFALIFDRRKVTLFNEFVASKDKCLPNSFEGDLVDGVTALIVKEFLIDPVFVIWRRSSIGRCHNFPLSGWIGPFL